MVRPERHSRPQWQSFYTVIRDLYITQNKTLAELMAIMADKYDFYASEKQYKTQLKAWALRKNATRDLSRASSEVVTSHFKRPGRALTSISVPDSREEQRTTVSEGHVSEPWIVYGVGQTPQHEQSVRSVTIANHTAGNADPVTHSHLLYDQFAVADDYADVLSDTDLEDPPRIEAMIHQFSTGTRFLCPLMSCTYKPNGFVYRGGCEAHIEAQHPSFTQQHPDWKQLIKARNSSSTFPANSISTTTASQRKFNACSNTSNGDQPDSRFVQNKHSVARQSNLTAYNYRSLPTDQSIRLLKLHPLSSSNEIFCELDTYEVEKSPQYHALSYTWGSDESSDQVHIGTNSLLRVRRNLSEFLRAIASSHKDTLNYQRFWVDAICINQQDIDERAKQVRQMTEIYAHASSVIVWLNDALYNSTAVAQFVDQMQDLDAIDEYMTFSQPKDESQAFSRLLEDSWFHRLWTLQEICVNSQVVFMLGTTSINFSKLIQAFTVFKSKSIADKALAQKSAYDDPSSKPFSVLDFVYEMKLSATEMRMRKTWNLSDLVRLTALLSADNIKHELSASIALSSNITDMIDYLGPGDVVGSIESLQVFTKLYIQQSGSIDIVFFPMASAYSKHPTWVRRQDKMFRTDLKTGFGRRTGSDTLCFSSAYKPIYAASKKSTAQARIIANKLFVTGFALAEIKETGDLAIETCIPRTWLSIAGCHGDLSMPNAFWRTLVADRYEQARYPPPYWARALEMLLQNSIGEDWIDIAHPTHGSRIPNVVYPMLAEVRRTISGRRIARTSLDTIALVPAATRIGDIAVILYGCSVPVILRKVDSHHEIIGECFMHGMMDGEACVDGHIDKQEFEIW